MEVLDKKTLRPHSALLGSPAAWPSWDASSVVLPLLCCILSLHHYSVVASSLNQSSCDDVKTPARGHKVENTTRKGETCGVLSIQYKEKTVIIMVQKYSEKKTPPKQKKTKKQVRLSERMLYAYYVKVPLLYASIINLKFHEETRSLRNHQKIFFQEKPERI